MHYDIFQLMDFLGDINGTSLHLAVEQRPVLSVGGRSRTILGPALTREDTTGLSNQVLPESHKLTLRETGRAEFDYLHKRKRRFRFTVERQHDCVEISVSALPP